MFVMSMGLLLFLKNSKNSLNKDVIYYLLVFINLSLFLTAFAVIVYSKDLVSNLMGSSLWFYGGAAFIFTGGLEEVR